MFILNGKYANCKVFTDNIDNETISQVVSMLNLKSLKDSQIRIMPDTHAGSGCTIGTTMTLKDKVVPNFVGVDIGCGMYLVKIKNKDIDLEKLDRVINTSIPAGFEVHEHPIKNFSKLKDIIADINIDYLRKSIGSLGGGNHFIELDIDDEGNNYLVIHTGSRHLGIEVCKYYQNIAYKTRKSESIEPKIKEIIERLKAEGKQRDIENTIKILRMQNSPIPKELCHIDGEDFQNYIHDMEISQEYAMLNRETIAEIIVDKMGFIPEESFHTIHNYIDINNMILRKGAISAIEGEKCIIPMNMRDGSLLCIGKGNEDWNFSAPHGAGRIMSRSEAKRQLDLNEFQKTMKDVYSTSVVESTIDEAPMVYKPMQEIIDNVKNTVEIEKIIKPIYNFKAH